MLFKKKDIEEKNGTVAPPTPIDVPQQPIMEAGNTEAPTQPEPTQVAAPRKGIFKKGTDERERAEAYAAFGEKYQDAYTANDFAKEGGEVAFYAEICKLLFATQNELREIKEVIKRQ